MNKKFGRLMFDINGTCLSDEDKSLIENKHVGGLILFSRNFQSFKQIRGLIAEIKSIKENIIIAVDQEGGRVQRFNKEFSKIPSMQKISNYAKANDDDLFLKEVGWLISSELIASGVDINFAPVLDIDEDTSSVIGDRAFANNVSEVIKMTSNFIDGMHEAGMSSTGKHFPGHGGIYEDSHTEHVEDLRLMKDLQDKDIKIYEELSKKLDAVMCAHVLFPKINRDLPSYSSFWLKETLKDNLKFEGLIFSDDLSMFGAGDESFSDKAINSLEAGCDMILVCNNRNEVINVINALDQNNVSLSSKMSKMTKKLKVDWDNLIKSTRREAIKEKLKHIEEIR
ncbi:MAG: beta-N-acetylhexosaminidase [Gammaproteobacteria bacterium]